MSKEDIDKLVSKCKQAKAQDLVKSIETGPTIWLLGTPAPAQDGLIGLATTPTQRIYFPRESILDTQEVDGRFLILVAADTNLLVREEQVVRFNPSACDCKAPAGAIAKKKGGTTAPTPGPIIIDCTPVCAFELVCAPFRHATGAVIMICLPQLVCRNPCIGEPA